MSSSSQPHHSRSFNPINATRDRLFLRRRQEIHFQGPPQLAPRPGLRNHRRAVAWSAQRVGDLLGRHQLPQGGFVVGRDPQVLTAANWSAAIFTAPAGSLFIPDTSVTEFNDPAQPLTGGGHNWVFDQGSTLLQKETEPGPAAPLPPAGRSRRTPRPIASLPIIKGGRVTNLGDIPFQGQAITPDLRSDQFSTPPCPTLPTPTSTSLAARSPTVSPPTRSTRRRSCWWPASRAGCSISRSTTSPTRGSAATPER